MINAILGKKVDQMQGFLENGTRIPVTDVLVPENPVIALRTKEKNGYNAIEVALGSKKKATKALLGNVKQAGLKSAAQFCREILVDESDLQNIKVGDFLKVSDLFKPGDIVNVTGISKGKGYAGVVKRHHFKGGPATHGQSDRERAPGSIGQTTTPGRVYKGKRMAGKMGNEQSTVRNLEVVDVLEDRVLINGLLPGIRGGLVVIKKVGEMKNFIPLYKSGMENIDSRLPDVSNEAPVSKAQEKSKVKEEENAGK